MSREEMNSAGSLSVSAGWRHSACRTFLDTLYTGGSTIVCLFEAGALQWDDDLLQNGQQSIETLVRMGMGIGRATGQAMSMTEA
jgi:hypothetical protein